MSVDCSGRIGANAAGARVTFFSDGADYLRDGSLILGTSRDNLSWSIYKDSGSAPSGMNPFGLLLPLGDITIDSTSSTKYSFATGKGTNADSTLEFTVTYYAPKGTAYYYIARFGIYKGMNDPTGTISNLTLAFAADWDIPAANTPANYGDYNPIKQIVYTRGGYSDPYGKRMGAIAILRDDDVGIPGGMNLASNIYVDPLGTFQVDSLWNRMELVNGYDTLGTIEDRVDVAVVGRDLVIDGSANDTFYFSVIIAGLNNSSVAGLEGTVAGAFYFACSWISPQCDACTCGLCGDADNNHLLTISDAVFLIHYIFGSGPEPPELCQGDSDGNVLINISDAVYLISYIFAGGGGPPICHH